jgi:hypothetical protein
MNEKAKRSGREEILEVFRSQGAHDISAENYLLKKQSLSRTATGPLRNNQLTDATGALTSPPDAPHGINLSGTEATDPARTPMTSTDNAADAAAQPPPIRVETFRIDLNERLAAMQLAQQKAKDQLNELKKQNPPTDEPPAE